MKIAVTSQNRRDVTEHAGRCRNFRVFEVADGAVLGSTFVELPREASFHDSSPHDPHPLDGVGVLITGGMGEGLRARLACRGIAALVTTERDPQRAVEAWLAGSLPLAAAHACARGAGCHGGTPLDAVTSNGGAAQ
jgi:predicted Fe-Mo cluster-binding NifX family protein